MKIKIVFDIEHGAPGDSNKLVYAAVVNNDGDQISSENIGEWIADGDVEALVLDVLPPLDKVTLTVVEATGIPLVDGWQLVKATLPAGATKDVDLWQEGRAWSNCYKDAGNGLWYDENNHSVDDPAYWRPASRPEGAVYYAADGTLMTADGIRSIFDDVDD